MHIVRRTEHSLSFRIFSDILFTSCVKSEQTYLFHICSWTGELLYQFDFKMNLSIRLPCAALHMKEKKRPKVKQMAVVQRRVHDDIDMI